MIDKLTKQIDNINESLNWLKTHKKEEYGQRFLQLVDERRKLKTIRTAAADNPAIAAFGRSQVGKSYLMNCMLKDKDKPFMVDDGNGKLYEFVKEINPPGGGEESTGVVTRFSSFKRNGEIYDDKYPVLARIFSASDVITIICDTYFNDINDYTSLSEGEIEELSQSIYEEYQNVPALISPVIEADDILNIKSYFKRNLSNAQSFNNKSAFFDNIALVIDRIPDTEYSRIFSNLWNNDPNFTRLFNHLLSSLRRLNFAQYVYMPLDSVIHNGIKENTMMSVQCLNMLFDNSSQYTTTVYLREGNNYRDTGIWTKSDICALCKEVDFKISENFLSSTNRYSMEKMPLESRNKLNSGDIEMSILKDNDLLDFPGARSRLKIEVATLSGNTVILNCFLRGKVAYLFKTYNSNMVINILLYCHHDEMNDVNDLYLQLKDWVNNYVGNTPEKRNATITKAGGSPLFYIATMFNKDMKKQDGEVLNNTNALNTRWTKRFEILRKECWHADEVEWVKNWAAPNQNFKNGFLLRDFKYSTKTTSILYDGFDTEGRETKMLMDEPYYENMRKTFISHGTVQQFFKDPALSWDVAATMNNDGTLYIIEQLYRVAINMSNTRDQQFSEQYRSATARLRSIMKEYHITDNKEELLKDNIRKSRRILREMDFTCNNDSYYFGHLLQGLQMKENICYNIVHQELMGNNISGQIHDFGRYQIIHNRCQQAGYPLSAQNTDQENWDNLIEAYYFDSQEEAEEYLREQDVNPELLFKPNFERRLLSFILADKIYKAWCDHFRSPSFTNEFCAENTKDKIKSSVMTNLVNNIITTSKSVKLADKMAQMIADIVNVVAIGTANENLISDMLVSTINDFVMDLGYSMLTEEQKATMRHLNEERKLHLFKYIDRDIPKRYSEEELTNLFNDMTTKPTLLVPSFEENYNKWMEYMMISFIAHLEVPKYDHAANEALEVILKEIDSE